MIDGQPYAVRLPTGGAFRGAANEWDAMLDILGEKNQVYHSKNILSWCQDTDAEDPDCRVYRGQLTRRHWNSTHSYTTYPHIGYRPVLEPLDPETLLPKPERIKDIRDASVLVMGTFYVNGIARDLPQDPFWCGDVPEYRNHMILAIGDTDPNPKKQLHFIKCGGLLWCDRNLITNVSWDTLDSFGLTYGREGAKQRKVCLDDRISESHPPLQHLSQQDKPTPVLSNRER